MKVALLTINHTFNYGAEMQSYATFKALQKLECNVELIDFRLENSQKENLKSRIVTLPRNIKFNRFWEKTYGSTYKYKDLDDLRSNFPSADLYLVGSDQVWNSQITRNNASAYFLDFGDENTLRASYASSFGLERWAADNILTEVAKKRLSTFCGLSVRENTGISILHDSFGLQAINVLDPTLLFDDYAEITGSVHNKQEIVCYKFKQDDAFFDAGRYISKQLSAPIKLLNNIRPKRGYKYVYPPSIEKWVKDIAQSSFVITDSFHGLAFSILYRKQFLVFVANPNRISRIKDLLQLLGLENRLFYNYDEIYNNKKWMEPIDFTEVERKLNVLRHKSWSYLENLCNKKSHI